MTQFLIVLGIMAIGWLVIAYWKKFWPFRVAKDPRIFVAGNIELPAVWDKQYDGPQGLIIFVQKHLIPDDKVQAVLDAIIGGIEDCIRDTQASKPNYTRNASVGGFGIILFVEPMAFNEDHSPALLVGSQRIQSAGTVINTFADCVERGPVNILLPAQPNWDFLDYLRASVHNEGEHLLEWYNDKNEFLRRAVSADIHPHWPPVNQARGLLSAAPERKLLCAGVDVNQKAYFVPKVK